SGIERVLTPYGGTRARSDASAIVNPSQISGFVKSPIPMRKVQLRRTGSAFQEPGRGLGVHEGLEGFPAVHLDHRHPEAVGPLQPVVTLDVDLLELERHPLPLGQDDLPGLVAQAAAAA